MIARGPAESDQQQVEHEPFRASVAVEERMNGLERAVQPSQSQWEFAGGQGVV